MSEMIERVANVLMRSAPAEPDREDFVKMARAAIEAMRNPTFEMQKSGYAALSHIAEPEHEDAMNAWYAMIDAALSDPAP